MTRSGFLGLGLLMGLGGCLEIHPTMGTDTGDAPGTDADPTTTDTASDGDPSRTDDPASDPDPPADGAHTRVTMGVFTTTAAGRALGYTASGRALMVRDGVRTTVYTNLSGLDPETAYSAHVHEYPCDVLEGGARYKRDPFIADTVRENEIWPSFTTDAWGTGRGSDEVMYNARPDAQSVIVQDPSTGDRIACATLIDDAHGATVFTGTFATLESAEPSPYPDLRGYAQLLRSGGHTYATVSIEGLAGSSDYTAHVHRYSCDVDDAGPHYKIDPSIEETRRDNEIWPTFHSTAEGLGEGWADVQHVARPDAMSIVLHDIDGSKLACADLSGPKIDYVTKGRVSTTFPGLRRGFRLTGSAELVRSLAGNTIVTLQVAGLDPGVRYMTHLHVDPCRDMSDRHYKIDPTIALELPDNELWATLDADATGRAAATTRADGHIARSEAQSVAIHDPIDAIRLGCIDLD